MAGTRLKIVVSNDDGIEALGLMTLVDTLSEWAECRVVAPADPQSGVGHALTHNAPIKVRQLDDQRIAVFGTPADCARLALSPGSPLLEEWADARRNGEIWLLSGINHGANLGMDIYPSGTAAAAREASLLGFRSMAISQYVGPFRRLDWGASARRARPVLKALLDRPLRTPAFWNINLPHPTDDDAECKVVHCLPDPSPQPARFVKDRKGLFTDESDYHARPRLPQYDIDVCFRGEISVSEVALFPATPGSERS